jgi:hypothetical protein
VGPITRPEAVGNGYHYFLKKIVISPSKSKKNSNFFVGKINTDDLMFIEMVG